MSLLNRELDYFLAICETRNLARAAEALGVSQPALTRSLQRLEGRFATKLFLRAPRGVELTPVGTALRARVEKARVTLNDAEKEVGQLAAGRIGKVRVGAGPTWVRVVSRSLFPRFINERPAAQVQLHVAFNPELFAMVEAGKLDFAVSGLLDTPPPDLVFREWVASDLVVIVRAGHPLTAKNTATLRDLVGFRSAAPAPGVRARTLMEERLARLGPFDRVHAIETNSWDAILDAVATTDLFSLAPRHEVERHEWGPRLAIVEMPELDLRQRTGIVLRKDAYLSPLATRAIELIEQEISGRRVPSSPAPVRPPRTSSRPATA